MPIQLDPTVFREERITLKAQLHRYLFDERAWGEVNRSKWFLSWYRDNQSWLATSALEKEMSSSQASEVSPLDADGKKNLARLLSNYESAPWTQQFIWWFRLPLTKLYSLNAGYDLWDRVQPDKVAATGFTSLKEAIGTHLLKIRPVSSVFAYFKQAQERIETKIKYSPSNQLRISFNEYLAELAKYGKQSKSFFSWQSHAQLALELGLNNAQVCRRKQAELARIPNQTRAQRKEQEVLYYVLLKEGIEKCVHILSHSAPDKATQEILWNQAIGDLVIMMKRGSNELSGSNPLLDLLQRMGRTFIELINEPSIEVQMAHYQEILSTHLRAELPAVAPSIQANEARPAAEVKRVPLNRESLAICKKLGVAGISDESQEVIWDNIRSRYKTLCQQLHPDKYPKDEATQKTATERFQALQNDYKSLLDEIEKESSGQNGEDNGLFDQELREERDRMNNFFDQFKQKLDGLNQDLNDFGQEVRTVYGEQNALLRKQLEQQTKILDLMKKREEQQRKQEEQQRRQEEQQRKQEEQQRKQEEQQERQMEQLKEEEEQAKVLQQQEEQIEQISQSMLQKMQQANPNVRLLRLTPQRCEVCIKLGVDGITENSFVVSWDAIRSIFDKLTKSFSFEELVKTPKQQMMDRFEELKKTYACLLDELSKPAAGENRANLDVEIAKEREELDKLTVHFNSTLKRYEDAAVEEAQQASGSRMSP